MRLLLLILSLVAATYAATDGKVHIPEKCEDVLAVKVCNKLYETAKNLKLTSQQVKEAVADAVKNGKTKAEEIYKSAQDFLQNKVLNKKCEDFTSSDNCAKLRDLAAKLKIQADKVEKFVIQAVAEGSVKAVELYNKVVEYYKTEIKTKTCEDFLSKTQCDRVRDVAKAFKIKTDELEKAIIEAVMKAYVEGKDVLQETFTKLKDLAKNTSCEDLLNPNVCASLRNYAHLTKISFPKIMDAVKEAIIKGYKLGKGLIKAVYSVIDYFYDCEDVFTKSSCERIKSVLRYIGVKGQEVDRIVREYAKKGIAKATDLYNKIYKELTNGVWCKINPYCTNTKVVKRSILSKEVLGKIAAKIKVQIQIAQKAINEAIVKAITNAKNTAEAMRKAIEELVLKTKMKASEIAKIIKDIVSKQTGQTISKRDIHDDLKKALAKAHGKVKEMIEKLMTLSKEHVKKIHALVMKIIKTVTGQDTTKRDIGELEVMEQFADAVVDEEFNMVAKEAEMDVDFVLDYGLQDDEQMEKRDISSVINKMKETYKKISDKVKNLLQKVKTLDLDAFKKMLQDAGVKMLGNVKDLYNKLKHQIEKQ